MPTKLLFRRLIPLIAATGLLLVAVVPVSAAASPTTETVKGFTESFPTVNPCTGDLGTVTVTHVPRPVDAKSRPHGRRWRARDRSLIHARPATSRADPRHIADRRYQTSIKPMVRRPGEG